MECPVIVLTNTHTNENERACNRSQVFLAKLKLSKLSYSTSFLLHLINNTSRHTSSSLHTFVPYGPALEQVSRLYSISTIHRSNLCVLSILLYRTLTCLPSYTSTHSSPKKTGAMNTSTHPLGATSTRSHVKAFRKFAPNLQAALKGAFPQEKTLTAE